MNQTSFFDRPIEPTIAPIEKTKSAGSLQERFEEFNQNNPFVYSAIRSIAHDLKRKGCKRVGIALIYERLRWLYFFQTSGEEYKLCNSYRAFYSRLLMKNDPDLKDFFTTRRGSHNEEDPS
jgi:hypothetical protein